jgi:hypothetical protein
VIKLIKFEAWTNWSGTPMAEANLSEVGTNWHTLAMTFQGSNITVSFDGTQEISVTDNNFSSVAPYSTGGISLELGTYPTPYTFNVDNLSVVAGLSNNPSMALGDSLNRNLKSASTLTNPSVTNSEAIATRVQVEIEHLAQPSGGQAQLTLRGQPGQAYLLEISTDLIHWQLLKSGAMPNAPFVFVDETANQSSVRFYRVRAAP